MNAPRVCLGDILELQRRKVEVQPGQTYVEVGLRSFGKGVFHKGPVPGTSLGEKRVFKVRPGDLLVSNVFGWEGALAVAGQSEDGLIGSHRFMTWTPKADDVHVTYVSHYLLSDEGMEALRHASPGSAGRNRTLSIKNFEAIQAPLPSIDDQRRIAARLDRFKRSARLQAGGRLHLNALEVVAGSREWATSLSEVLEADVDEFDVEPDAVYRRAGVLSAGRGLFSHGDLPGRETKYRRLRRVRSGQVVLSRLTAFIGGVAVVSPAFDGFVLSQEYPTFSLRRGVPRECVRALLVHPEVEQQLRSASTGVGNTRQRVSAEDFLAVRIPDLTPSEREEIARLHRHVSRHEELVRHRSELAAALLPAARNEAFNKFG